MKLRFSQYLLERRQDQIYAYHATDFKNLRTILSQGLVPNKVEGGYGSDEINQFGVPLTPHPGIYFTKNNGGAVHIAKLYPRGIVLIAKVTPNTLTMDEDNIQYVFSHWGIIDALEHGESPKKILDEIINNDSFKDADPRYIKSLRSSFKTYVLAFRDFYMEDKKNEDYLQRYKSAQLELTKKLSPFVKRNKDIFSVNKGRMIPSNEERTTTSTFKVDGTVGFSGRNRIVGIYDPIEQVGWGDIGSFKGSEHHLYNNPMEFLTKSQQR